MSAAISFTQALADVNKLMADSDPQSDPQPEMLLTPGIKMSRFDSLRQSTNMPQDITLDNLIKEIQSDAHKDGCLSMRTDEYKYSVRLIEERIAKGDKTAKAELDRLNAPKAQLPCVTISALCEGNGHAAKNVVSHTGLYQCDYDLKDNEGLYGRLAVIKDELQRMPCVAAYFDSPRGGLKVIVAVDYAETNGPQHKIAWQIAQDKMAAAFGLEYDTNISNISRTCLLSYDPKAWAAISVMPLPFVQVEEPQRKVAAVNTKATGKAAADYPPRSQSEEVELARSALMSIPSRPAYEEWLRISSAVWEAVGESDGNALLNEWSAEEEHGEYSKKYPQRLKQVGAGTLFKMAQDNCWSYPKGNKANKAALEWAAKLDTYDAIKKELDEAVPTKPDPKVEKPAKCADEVFKSWVASTDEHLAEMEQYALDAVYVFPDIALLGELTIINAKWSSGKTLLALWLLKNRDLEQTRDLEIFFINADDSYNGGIEKMNWTKEYGIQTCVPGQRGFSIKGFLENLQLAIDQNKARNKVIILDTLKKFVDMMDKKNAAKVNRLFREFASAGGTVIALAHVNKHEGEDGKSIAEGVGDFSSDFDCAYILQRNADQDRFSDKLIVTFENMKRRGPTASKVSFQYDASDDKTWPQRFKSIKLLTEDEEKTIASQAKATADYDKNVAVIRHLMLELKSGPKSKSDLIRNNPGKETGSQGHRTRVLSIYDETNPNEELRFWGTSSNQAGRGLNHHLLKPYEEPAGQLPWA